MRSVGPGNQTSVNKDSSKQDVWYSSCPDGRLKQKTKTSITWANIAIGWCQYWAPEPSTSPTSLTLQLKSENTETRRQAVIPSGYLNLPSHLSGALGLFVNLLEFRKSALALQNYQPHWSLQVSPLTTAFLNKEAKTRVAGLATLKQILRLIAARSACLIIRQHSINPSAIYVYLGH